MANCPTTTRYFGENADCVDPGLQPLSQPYGRHPDLLRHVDAADHGRTQLRVHRQALAAYTVGVQHLGLL